MPTDKPPTQPSAANAQRFLVAESETAEEREERRRSAGKSSGETYASTLEQLRPRCAVDIVRPAEDGCPPAHYEFDRYAAVFLTGSPLHVYDDTPEVRRQLDFMRAVFASGIPSFGSCAGLQVAVAAAGGKVRKMPRRMEAAVARRLTKTSAGRRHPLLRGRPDSWDAAAIHGDEVEELPEGATLLAGNATTRIQAAEIRFGNGVFWGVQYHPELAIGEIAAAIDRQANDLISAGLARNATDVRHRVDLLNALHSSPDNIVLRWLIGVDDQFCSEGLRRTELTNFLDTLTELDQRNLPAPSHAEEALH